MDEDLLEWLNSDTRRSVRIKRDGQCWRVQLLWEDREVGSATLSSLEDAIGLALYRAS